MSRKTPTVELAPATGLKLKIKLKMPHKATPGDISTVEGVAGVAPSHESSDDLPDLTNLSQSETSSSFTAPVPKNKGGQPYTFYVSERTQEAQAFPAEAKIT